MPDHKNGWSLCMQNSCGTCDFFARDLFTRDSFTRDSSTRDSVHSLQSRFIQSRSDKSACFSGYYTGLTARKALEHDMCANLARTSLTSLPCTLDAKFSEMFGENLYLNAIALEEQSDSLHRFGAFEKFQ